MKKNVTPLLTEFRAKKFIEELCSWTFYTSIENPIRYEYKIWVYTYSHQLMSLKSCQFLYNTSLYKYRQHFWDILYLIICLGFASHRMPRHLSQSAKSFIFNVLEPIFQGLLFSSFIAMIHIHSSDFNFFYNADIFID